MWTVRRICFWETDSNLKGWKRARRWRLKKERGLKRRSTQSDRRSFRFHLLSSGAGFEGYLWWRIWGISLVKILKDLKDTSGEGRIPLRYANWYPCPGWRHLDRGAEERGREQATAGGDGCCQAEVESVLLRIFCIVVLIFRQEEASKALMAVSTTPSHHHLRVRSFS